MVRPSWRVADKLAALGVIFMVMFLTLCCHNKQMANSSRPTLARIIFCSFVILVLRLRR